MSDVLVLYWHPAGVEMRPSVDRHLHALDVEGVAARVEYVNTFAPLHRSVRRHSWDAVVLHTTFLCMRWSEIFADYAGRVEWLADRDCVKIAIPQDEYDHAEILDEWLAALGVTDVLTNFGPEHRHVLYPLLHSRVRFHEVLTGYIDEEMAARAAAAMQPAAKRPLDIVYRAANLPYWFGSHGRLKVDIGTVVRERANALGLRTDISSRHEDTIYGDLWSEFLLSGKAVIGCETGSSVLDRRGELQAAIRSMLAAEPDLSWEEVDSRMPAGWDDYRLFAIGPRHFEAVVTKTCQLLVEGDYSGILLPGRHYIPIHRDLRNLDEVLERLRDTDALQRMAEDAYEDIYLSGRYSYDVFRAVVRSSLPARMRSGRRAYRTPRVVAGPSTNARPMSVLRAFVRTPELPIRLLRLLAATVADASLRGLVARTAAASLWGQPRELLRDCLRLGLMREAATHTPVSFEEPEPGTLILTTRTPGTEPASRVLKPGVYWDHSAVATAVPLSSSCRLGVVRLGADGLYRFETLSTFAQRRPNVVRNVLARAFAEVPS